MVVPARSPSGLGFVTEEPTKNLWKKSKPEKVPSAAKIDLKALEETEKRMKFLEDSIASKTQSLRDLESRSSETQRQKDEIERHYLVESDHEEAYPTLEKRHGDPLEQVPKKILAVTKTQW